MCAVLSALKQTFTLSHAEARRRAVQAVQNAPEGYAVIVKPPTRNLEQNALLWALLTEVSNQVVWHGNRLTQDEWKDVFSSVLHKQKVIPNLDGTGFVVCGRSTSEMSKAEFSDLLELIHAFMAQHEVRAAA